MVCSRGKASPNENTKLQLFCSSAGYCQNPECRRELFVDTGSKRIHVAEMAHVFSASDSGPRASAELSPEERGSFNNLILLCANCHTMIDKAEADYPDSLLTSWKENHGAKLAEIFGVPLLKDRRDVRKLIVPLLSENASIHAEYNPDLDYRFDPESGVALVWQRYVRERIIPNNRKILTILDVNRDLIRVNEFTILEKFRRHLFDLEARHLTDSPVDRQSRFPAALSNLMLEE